MGHDDSTTCSTETAMTSTAKNTGSYRSDLPRSYPLSLKASHQVYCQFVEDHPP
jgi:hypothetical protein